LGFMIWMVRLKDGEIFYPHVEPSKNPAINQRSSRRPTQRERTIMPLDWIVNEVNATVPWMGRYFHYRNCSQTLVSLRYHVEQRMITHLRKRHKIRDRKAGCARFKPRALYEKYGLYKVPTTASWMKAHALR